jgi:medium-chain acyl-[acyl-carrier-protein] hydrolase
MISNKFGTSSMKSVIVNADGGTLTPSGAVSANVKEAENSAWFYRPARRSGPRYRLFCFPHAGVAASVFRLWPTDLPPELELFAVQLPGRGARFSERAISSIPMLADAIVGAITPHLDLPFVLFGHSMGAVLAAEVAHGLAARSLPQPHRLIVSAHRPPRIPDPHSPLGGLPDPDFVFEINRRYGSIPPEILAEPDILALLLSSLRADFVALEAHNPPVRRPLGCSISAFGGAGDAFAPRAHLEAWRDETIDSFDLHLFRGGHFYLEPEKAAVLAQLSAIFATLLAIAD